MLSSGRPGDGTEMEDLVRRMRQGLAEGALGFGFGIAYTPGATADEIEDLFGVAGFDGAPVFVHTRAFGLEPIREVLEAAGRLGTSLHIVHLWSSANREISVALSLIDGARAEGVDVTTELYTYTAASTVIESAIFEPG